MPVGWLAFGITASTAFSRAGKTHIYSCHVGALLRSRKTWWLLTHCQLLSTDCHFPRDSALYFHFHHIQIMQMGSIQFFFLLCSENYHVNYIWACHMSACETHQKCIEALIIPFMIGYGAHQLMSDSNSLRIRWTRRHPTKWKIKK